MNRPTQATIQAFRDVAKCFSASRVFADVQSRSNVMHSAIKPIFPGKLVGIALPVRLSAGDLQDPLAALEIAQSGDMIVVDAFGETETSVWGGLMGALCMQRGVVGAIIDGAGRDIDELRDLKFQIYTRAITARGTHTMFSGRKSDVAVNVPITCGGVIVEPGDMIIANEIGVTVVPYAKLNDVLKLAREQAEREEFTRREIAKGKTVAQLLAEFGRI